MSEFSCVLIDFLESCMDGPSAHVETGMWNELRF